MRPIQAAGGQTAHGRKTQEHTRSSENRRIDAIAGLRDGPRARDAFLLRSRMSPPWSLRIQDEAPLTVVAVVSGWAWLQAGRAARRIGGGDVAILRGPAPYTVADAPDRPAQAVILPGQRYTGPDGAEQHVMG